MHAVFLLGIAGGFLLAVVFVMLVDGAHAVAERDRRVLLVRRRSAARRASAEISTFETRSVLKVEIAAAPVVGVSGAPPVFYAVSKANRGGAVPCSNLAVPPAMGGMVRGNGVVPGAGKRMADLVGRAGDALICAAQGLRPLSLHSRLKSKRAEGTPGSSAELSTFETRSVLKVESAAATSFFSPLWGRRHA